jgi:hypothetical protein
MLYFRNSNISRDVVDNRQRLSVRITPHVENTRSLAVLVAGIASNFLAKCDIFGSL